MPYIKQDKRDVLDPAIDEIVSRLRGLQLDDPSDNIQGNMNYIVSRLLDKLYNANYQEVNNGVGMLICATLEYYRRMAAPYEDQKIYENGDAYERTATHPHPAEPMPGQVTQVK